jgi:hypothetical protein
LCWDDGPVLVAPVSADADAACFLDTGDEDIALRNK